MTDEADRVTTGEQARAAWDQFVGPACALLRAEYATKLSKIAGERAMTGEALKQVEKLAMAIKVVDQVEAQIAAVIGDGRTAQADMERAGNMARLSTEERRYAGY